MSDKREAILQAMLELVAERGLQDAPMSLVARRSGASAGVIYHYFASKEELLRALYVRVKADSVAAVNAAVVAAPPSQEAFERIWLGVYRYFAEHRREALFLYQFEGVPGYKTPAVMELLEEDRNYSAVLNWLRSGIADLRIKDLPLTVLYELSFAVASRLAFRQGPLDEGILLKTASSCWQAVAR